MIMLRVFCFLFKKSTFCIPQFMTAHSIYGKKANAFIILDPERKAKETQKFATRLLQESIRKRPGKRQF